MTECGQRANFCEPSLTHRECTCTLEAGHCGEHTNGRLFWNVGRAPRDTTGSAEQ